MKSTLDTTMNIQSLTQKGSDRISQFIGRV
jgi:hypothetical protein